MFKKTGIGKLRWKWSFDNAYIVVSG